MHTVTQATKFINRSGDTSLDALNIRYNIFKINISDAKSRIREMTKPEIEKIVEVLILKNKDNIDLIPSILPQAKPRKWKLYDPSRTKMANSLAIFSLFVLLSLLESASTKKIIGLCPEELNRYCDCRLLGKKVQINCYNFESIGICTVLEILEDRQKELNESCSTCTTCKRHTQLTIEKLKFSRCTEPLGEMDKFPKLNITALEFTECEISSIPLDSFIALNENLVELTIQGAKLLEVPNFKKLGLTNLQKINLDENLITNITGPIFGGLPKLRKLSLRHNRISNISRNAFGNSGSTLELQTLDFSHNNLSKLPLEAFSIQLANLTSLKLSHNRLYKLRFNKYSKLETVNLDGNEFKDFPTSLFSGCPQLQSLDFSNNQLTKFDEKLFQQPMQNLSDLSLGRNNISEFAVEISKSLPALARLSLSQNGIKTLKGISFANINSTQFFLDLSENQIGNLDEYVFANTSLSSIDLERNNFTSLADIRFSNTTKVSKYVTLSGNLCSLASQDLFQRYKLPVYAAENVTDPNKYISAYCDNFHIINYNY